MHIILRSAHTEYLCVLCGSQNKQRLFPYTALTGWFLWPRRCVFTVRYGLGLYIDIYNSPFCRHRVFMCFVWISQQTAIISLYSINWLVFITETQWVYCAVGLNLYTYNSTFCPHSVFMCFVWITAQTAIISLYSTNWLVFITETGCVYCPVRDESLRIINVNFCLQPSKAQWLLYVPPGLTFTNSTFCPHSVFMCFVWISEQTAVISLYSINWLVFITETECVYCVVRTVFTAVLRYSYC
jgi:hypothetical protein